MSMNSRPLNEVLKEAAANKDASLYWFQEVKPESNTECLKYVYPATENDEGGNIFHIAAFCNNQRFIDVALNKLPEDLVHFLLCQRNLNGSDDSNPIHLAARKGYISILKALVKFYNRAERSVEPWLAQDGDGKTPLHYVLEKGFEFLGLKILSLRDVHKILMIDDKKGRGPLFVAVERGLNRVADYILRSTSQYSLSGESGMNVLTCAPKCSDEICNQLIRQHCPLLASKDLLKCWAEIGKVDPFKQVLEGDFVPSYLKSKFILQLDNQDRNALHYVQSVEVAKILVEAYKLERPEAQKSSLPWFQKFQKNTPLGMAIMQANEEVALYFLSLDSVYFVTQNHEDHLLYKAVNGGFEKLAHQILDIVEQHNLTQSLISPKILHVAPNCKEVFLKRLLKSYPQLIEETEEHEENVLHSWIVMPNLWPIKHILKDDDWALKRSFLSLLDQCDNCFHLRKPLHMLETNMPNDFSVELINLLISEWEMQEFNSGMSWSGKDNRGHTPLSNAITLGKEELARCFLSFSKIREYKEEELADALFLAVEKNLQQFIKDLLHQYYGRSCTLNSLRSYGMSVLHIGHLVSEKNCKYMIKKWPGLINELDVDKKTPLETASQGGATWLVQLILLKDRSSIIKTPLAWVEACNNGHVGTVIAFAESPYFRNLCRQHRDTPLHHCKDLSFKDYQTLLDDESIKELKNIQNSKGETPLHRAIRNENKNLTELLLTTVDVDQTLKDHENKTPMDLLQEKCHSNEEWSRMCQVIGVDPKVKTMYI